MKIIYGKIPTENEKNLIKHISASCGILFDTARILYYRGYDTVEKVSEFLSPSKKGFLDPFGLSGMREAVDRIKKARDNGEKVLISGDYDADGICASTVLHKCLKEFGVESYIIIPEREDGYGLNKEKILSFYREKGVKLLITVDCGISEKDNVKELMNCGLDVIITDHHEPPENLPDCTLINPKLNNPDYAFNGLCGAGVAYKLGYALIGERADEYLDFVTLATVADSMDLTGENRCLVYEGLKLFSKNKLRSCFKYLIGDTNRQITAQSLAFTIAPRVNAGGRMGDARSALELFLSEDENEIFDLSAKLNNYNTARQVECDLIYREAKEKITKNGDYKKSIIMTYDSKWKVGFIGIVAARLVEDYNRPVIVFAGQDGDLKGSARSVDGVNVYDAICSAKEYALSFGGHSQAAGVTVSGSNFQNFYDKVDKYLSGIINPEKAEDEFFVEWETKGQISVRFAEEIEKLEPFGTGNKRPYFCTSAEAVKCQQLKNGSQHYSISVGGMEFLNFNGEKDVTLLTLPVKKKIIYEVNLSEFKGYASVKGYVRKIVPESFLGVDLDLYYFRNEIIKAKQDSAEYKTLSFNEIKLGLGYGTLYVLNNGKDVKRCSDLGLEISYFTPSVKGKNSVCVSPEFLPCGYEKIIYLYKPLTVLKADNVIVIKSEIANEFKYLKTDRQTFTEAFNLFKTLSGREFINSVIFYNENKFNMNAKQFIFCLEVFIELGIFSVKGGRLFYDSKVKSQLENSKIYSKIFNIER